MCSMVELNLTVIRNNSDGHKIKTEYRYEFKYRDLCYAVAKAMTDVMKDYGFYGYHYSTSDNGIEIHQLLFLKAVALNRMDVWTLIHRNE